MIPKRCGRPARIFSKNLGLENIENTKQRLDALLEELFRGVDFDFLKIFSKKYFGKIFCFGKSLPLDRFGRSMGIFATRKTHKRWMLTFSRQEKLYGLYNSVSVFQKYFQEHFRELFAKI